LVWRLDRWEPVRIPDLIGTIRELTDTGVSFVCHSQKPSIKPPHSRRKAMAGMLAVFAESAGYPTRKRVKAGALRNRGKAPQPPATRVPPRREVRSSEEGLQ